MRRMLAMAGLMMLVTGCEQAATPSLAVSDAWVRLAPVPGRPAAAYFTVTGGETTDRLTGISSAKVATIELHESMEHGGMMSMKPIASIEVAAKTRVTFEPGAKHAMLFGVDPSVTPGASLPLDFRFASGRTLRIDAKTVTAGDDAGHSGAH